MNNNDNNKNINLWLIVVAVMVTAVLEVLDSIIVSIALPNMKNSLGANTNQITWVLTSYIVASAISIPLTGFLQARLGRKRLLFTCTSAFMVSSMLCGLATNLDMMIVFRILQGFSGAVLIPLSQSTIQTTFPREKLSKGMAAWGIGIMAAPIMGPTIGAWITQTWDWRFIFYLNVPICLMSLYLVWRYVPDTPRSTSKIDLVGLSLLAVSAATLQWVLDQGNEKNWFTSHMIVSVGIISIVSLGTFIVRGLLIENNIINLRIFRDRNFALSFFMMMIYCACLFGTLSMQPLLLQTLYHYPMLAVGMAMAPRGVAAGLAMGLAPSLLKIISVKKLLAIGVIFTIIGTYMLSQFDLSTPLSALTIPLLLQGFGMGCFFVPLSTAALLHVPKEQNAEASGFFNYGRMLGTSIGISILSTIISRESQINWNRLGAHVQPFNANLHHWLHQQHLTIHQPVAHAMLARIIARQSTLVAFIDGFYALSIAFVMLLPLVLWMKRIDKSELGKQMMRE